MPTRSILRCVKRPTLIARVQNKIREEQQTGDSLTNFAEQVTEYLDITAPFIRN